MTSRRFEALRRSGVRDGYRPSSVVWDPLTDGTLASGLILDLCPDYAGTVTLNGSTVAQINDRSGAGNHFNQATAANQPTYVTGDANFGGRNTMSFDGTNDGLFSVASVTSPGTAATFAVIFRSNTTATGINLEAAQGLNGSWMLYTGVAQFTAAYSNPWGSRTDKIPNGFAANTSYRRIVTLNAANAVAAWPSHYVNGVDVGSYTATAASNGSVSGGTWALGCRVGGSFSFPGTIARSLAWNRILSGAEITQLDNGLKAFFGLP